MAAKRKASGRKSFSAETKAEALRLIREEGYSRKQVATQIGCSVAALQQWKAAAPSGKIKVAAKETVKGTMTAEPVVKSVKKARRRRRKGMAKKTVATVPTVKLSITFEEFVQDYWREHPEATDVMRLPSDLMPTAVQYVNNVLRYAYDQFCGQ